MTATSHQTQRRAVRGTALLLALLAVGVGLRNGSEDRLTRVPVIAAGTPEAAARGALRQAELRPVVERQSDADLPSGRVVDVLPVEGTELARGEDVVLVVSTGPTGAELARAENVAPPAPVAQVLAPSAVEAPADPEAPRASAASVRTQDDAAPARGAEAPAAPARRAEAPAPAVQPPTTPGASATADGGRSGSRSIGANRGPHGDTRRDSNTRHDSNTKRDSNTRRDSSARRDGKGGGP